MKFSAKVLACDVCSYVDADLEPSVGSESRLLDDLIAHCKNVSDIKRHTHVVHRALATFLEEYRPDNAEHRAKRQRVEVVGRDFVSLLHHRVLCHDPCFNGRTQYSRWHCPRK